MALDTSRVPAPPVFFTLQNLPDPQGTRPGDIVFQLLAPEFICPPQVLLDLINRPCTTAERVQDAIEEADTRDLKRWSAERWGFIVSQITEAN